MKTFPPAPADPSRRRFVQGLALGGAAASLGLLRSGEAWSQSAAAQPTVLSGTEFDLTIGEIMVDITGHRRSAMVVNGQLPGPTLRWREGDTVTLRVRNTLSVTSSIHWHGIILPYQMDGVPGLSFPGIAPGETFTYRFTVRQSGTYWYHSHSGFQEQSGVYGAIVIEPREAARSSVRDFVLLLSDWSDRDPASLMATLKRQSDYYNYNQPTAVGFLRDVEQLGMRKALSKRRMWNQMRMSPTDLSDISGATYTYLCNGVGPAGNWTGVFTPGERVRLRIINGSSMTYFDVRIPGLQMTVVSADGQAVEPVTVDEFRLGVAETLDVMVQPGDAAWTVFAQAIDRSGYARATLAPRAGMQAAVPPMDPVPRLGMGDMMGAMAGMSGMAHQASAVPAMGGMHGASTEHTGHAGMQGMQGMASSMPAHGADGFPVWQCRTGPSVDMCVPSPRTSIDDPGVGLRHNGRRVLSYADLRTIGGALDPREPGRTLTLHLTGNMERYIWGFDGRKYSQAAPIALRYGERVRVTLINDTMMNHPIHLHGMWSELEAPDGSFQARKHTITVQPAQQVSYLVSANAPGHWAYHCHMLYHMEAGMFREVVVA